MVHHKMWQDKTPVQPAFQYRGKQCKLICSYLRNGIITGYNITYNSQTENDNGFVPAGPNDRQANLTGLKEFVNYNISVVAATEKGDGPLSIIVVRTDEDSEWHILVLSVQFGLKSNSACINIWSE